MELKDLVIMRLRCRTPETILYGVDLKLLEVNIVAAYRERKEVLQRASLKLRNSFMGEISRNMV